MNVAVATNTVNLA